MKRLFSLSLLLAATAWATNGNHFIGVSPAATAMGGTGVANFTNVSDALFRNPSLLSGATLGEKRTQAEISATMIKNNASAQATLAGSAQGLKASTAPAKFPFTLAGGYALDNELAVGFGILTMGGATVDQVGQAELNQLKTSNSLIRMVPAVSYKFSPEFSVAIAPHLAYASLSVNHANTAGVQSSRKNHGAVGFGGQIAASYQPTKELTFGLSVISETNITYKEVLNLDGFGPNAANAALVGLDDLDGQFPMELALGAGYQVTPDLTVTADYRYMGWNQAKAFAELGWQNQHLLALGVQYKIEAWKFRGGFNYGKSPIRDVTGENGFTESVNFQGHQVFRQSITNLNLIAFPAITESHVTAGAGYDVNADLTVDVGFALALKKSVTRAGTGIVAAPATQGPYSILGEASQWSLGLGAAYRL